MYVKSRIVWSMVLLVLAIALAAPVYGHPEQDPNTQAETGMGMGMRGMGMHGMGTRGTAQAGKDELDSETRLKLLDAKIKHIKATSQLRTDMMVRQVELQKLWLADDPDYEKIRAKQREIGELRLKLQEKALDHRMAVDKLLPESMRGHHGMGMMHGMRGMGMSGGMHGGGMGMQGMGMGMHGMGMQGRGGMSGCDGCPGMGMHGMGMMGW